MKKNSRSREWAILVTVFGVLPGLFIGFILLPCIKRDAVYIERQRAATQRLQELPPVQPLSPEERKVLEDPAAPWRYRIPFIPNDGVRLGHYHRVVTDLQQTCRQAGIKVVGVRSTWDSIHASFTLPPVLASGPDLLPEGGNQGRLQGWVLEAQVDGPTPQLFRAMEGLPLIEPLLEPVGLRWEGDDKGLRQYLVLRNLVLTP
jgi:hypothetical protein